MNIYLDIDGVLIQKDGKPADYVSEFLEYITNNHNVYWLTTHCKGDSNQTVKYLSNKLPKECAAFLSKIKPTNWQTLKTEAIDFKQQFVWLDDYIMESEINVLKDHKAQIYFIKIDLNKEPGMLKRLKNFI